jgi:hypothetical protein
MRATARRFVVCLLSMLVLWACDDEGGTTPADAGHDTVLPDGPVSDGVQPEGALPDTAADSVGGTQVVVTVYDDGVGQAGVEVAFHDPTGTLLHQAQTDGSGVASAEMPQGGMVTVGRLGAQGIQQLTTVAQVKPGEAVFVGSPQPLNAVVGKLRLKSSQPVQNATGYLVDLGCKEQKVTSLDTPVELDVPAACLLGGSLNVFVSSLDQQDLPYSYATAVNVALASGQTVDVDVTNWSVDWASLVFSIKDHPAGAAALQVNAATVAGGLAYYSVAYPTIGTAYPGSSATMLHAYANGFGDSLEYLVGFGYGDAVNPTGESALFRRDKTRPTAITVMAAAEVLPPPASVTVSSNQVSWTAPTGLGEVDGVLMEVRWLGTTPTRWTVLCAPANNSFTLPQLPAPLSGWVPGPASGAAETVVTYVEADTIAGYDKLRLDYGPGVLAAPFPATDMTFRLSSTKAQ